MSNPAHHTPGGPAGVVLSGSGTFYIAEAVAAARSSLRHNRVPHLLFASEATETPDGLSVQTFEPSGNPYADKIANMGRSPFERSIYLDSDTYVVDEIVHVLDVLDHYDLAVAFAPGYRGLDDPAVPSAFYEFNTGVLAWRASAATAAFMQAWEETYRSWLEHDEFPGAQRASRGRRADQPAFRRCAWEHGLRVFVLGPEYNFRLGFPASAIGRVRVIHGESEDHPALAARLNASELARTWPPPPTLRERLRGRLRRTFGRSGPALPRWASREQASQAKNRAS